MVLFNLNAVIAGGEAQSTEANPAANAPAVVAPTALPPTVLTPTDSNKPATKVTLTPYVAEYKIEKLGVAVGHAVMTLSDKGNGIWEYSSRVKPYGVASLFTKQEVVESSQVRLMPDNSIKPLIYEHKHKGGDKAKNVQYVYDWNQKTVTTVVNGAPKQFPLDKPLYDPQSAQLFLSIALQTGAKSIEVPVLDDGEINNYTLSFSGTETLKTKLGEYQTQKLSRVHGKRVTHTWIAPRLNFIPVRIEQIKNQDSSVSMSLDSVRWSQ
ncbi:MAG: DUF3108 domain-containing protein [Gammaproteobacteria bacterium]|nr:DUF3108 domain-containing protein [Gammaproteobacteria bacterium]